MTDTNVSKFFYRSLLNHFFQYTNKNISVKPLFNLHYLSLFRLPFTRSKFVQFTEDLAVITALIRVLLENISLSVEKFCTGNGVHRGVTCNSVV